MHTGIWPLNCRSRWEWCILPLIPYHRCIPPPITYHWCILVLIPYHGCIPPLHTIPWVPTNFLTIPLVHTNPPLPPIRQRQTQEAIRQSQTGEIFRKRALLHLSLSYLGKWGKLRKEKYSAREQCFDVWISKVNWGWIKLLKFCARPPGTFPRQWELRSKISYFSKYIFKSSCVFVSAHRVFPWHWWWQLPRYRNTVSKI